MEKTEDKTYFGLNIYKEDKYTGYVSYNDIKTLPFFNFWEESIKGSTMPVVDEKIYVYLHDWERFCDLFIKTGKHRFNKNA